METETLRRRNVFVLLKRMDYAYMIDSDIAVMNPQDVVFMFSLSKLKYNEFAHTT